MKKAFETINVLTELNIVTMDWIDENGILFAECKV